MELQKICWLGAILFLFAQCYQSAAPQIDLTNASDTLELFGKDIISTHLYERDLAISPEGDRIIYSLADFKQQRRVLVEMSRQKNGWSEGQIIPFSGQYHDIEPFFSIDGKRLYFASTRPIDSDSSRSDYNIWSADWSGSSWNDPIALPSSINSPSDEYYPSVSRNGNLYFTATRASGFGREDIYVAPFDGSSYSDPVPLDTNINTGRFEFNAYIHPDEDYLIFSSFGRPDGLGGGDLYISYQGADGEWTLSKNLGPLINSTALDYCPFVDFSRNVFYFTSERAAPLPIRFDHIDSINAYAWQANNGFGNIYRIRLDQVLN